MAGFLSRERIVARPGFNRWLVPPAALAIHLCIGQAYAISVFNLPLGRAIGITQPAALDWKLTTLGWIYTLAIVFLGLSAAFAGTWLERAGPRKVGLVAACCWGGGFLIAGLDAHQVVPRPSRHGDRDGDDVVRRRRPDRRPPVGRGHGPVRHRDLGRR